MLTEIMLDRPCTDK